MNDDDSAVSSPGPLLRYQLALAKGDFNIQQCKDCGQHVFYPRAMCNHCGSNDLKWIEASGRGQLYSYTIIHQRAEKGGDYNVALIDLEEGPRMMSRIVGVEPDEVSIGMEVRAHVGLIDEKPAVLFSVVEEKEEAEW